MYKKKIFTTLIVVSLNAISNIKFPQIGPSHIKKKMKNIFPHFHFYFKYLNIKN